MSFDYIRSFYGVPAKRGALIKFQGQRAKIVSVDGAYLRARMLTGRRKGERLLLHPTWEIVYLSCSKSPNKAKTKGARRG